MHFALFFPPDFSSGGDLLRRMSVSGIGTDLFLENREQNWFENQRFTFLFLKQILIEAKYDTQF
jgi:hypothetical protein